MQAERRRLEEAGRHARHWKRWGPYLAERSWGNPREDYSPHGTAWEYFPHDHARSRAYRWTEDGILGICDNHQRICFSIALWNGRDSILKERLFGLSGNEGNHGEDVKEYYYYLDSTPTHSYLKGLYKYPQAEFPYAGLVEETRRRGRGSPEYELIDTGVFNEDRYFDIFVEYAKADADDVLIRITAINRGPERAKLHLLPTVWFRNTWSWGYGNPCPEASRLDASAIALKYPGFADYRLWFERAPAMLFTENETNTERLYNYAGAEHYYKDAFHECVVHERGDAVNAAETGTKACGWYQDEFAPGEQKVYRLRLHANDLPAPDFEKTFENRMREADEFYSFSPAHLSEDAHMVQRLAFAGLLWSKQFYHYVIQQWLDGDPSQPP